VVPVILKTFLIEILYQRKKTDRRVDFILQVFRFRAPWTETANRSDQVVTVEPVKVVDCLHRRTGVVKRVPREWNEFGVFEVLIPNVAVGFKGKSDLVPRNRLTCSVRGPCPSLAGKDMTTKRWFSKVSAFGRCPLFMTSSRASG